MRTGENNRDLTTLEKKAGQKAAKNIGRKLRTTIKRLHYPLGKDKIANSGIMKRATARAKMKFDALDSVAITAPYYAFINHYGFEGIKSNRVKMTLKPTNLFNEVLDNNKDIERLADEIGVIRAEEVTSKIRW